MRVCVCVRERQPATRPSIACSRKLSNVAVALVLLLAISLLLPALKPNLRRVLAENVVIKIKQITTAG